jgi:hypothetical protein
MKDQVHIRNAEAAHLARTWAKQTGKSITEVVLDALRRYRPETRPAASREREERFFRLLKEDQAAFRARLEPEIPIEDLYDPETGLPR